MRFISCLFLTLLATTAAGQDAFRFYPRSAAPEGGAEIQLFANGSLRFTAPQVFFGDAPSPHVTLVTATSLTTVAPSHAVGIVSITILDNGSVFRANYFVFIREVEEIIIPIAYQPIDASFGTRWVSEISVFNDSDDTVPIDPEVCSFIGRPYDCSQTVRRLSPHSSMRIEPWSASADYPAMILRPPADHAARLHFNVRLRETSRDPDGPGTEIPIVRDRDFQQKQVWLPSIPTDARFRSTLRVFTRWFSVTVRVKDNVTSELLWQREIGRNIPTDSDPFGTVTLSDLLTSALVRAHETVRIEVESLSPVWAMVTLTDNATQRVQIFTPQ
jgi:hypothetical protein